VAATAEWAPPAPAGPGTAATTPLTGLTAPLGTMLGLDGGAATWSAPPPQVQRAVFLPPPQVSGPGPGPAPVSRQSPRPGPVAAAVQRLMRSSADGLPRSGRPVPVQPSDRRTAAHEPASAVPPAAAAPAGAPIPIGAPFPSGASSPTRAQAATTASAQAAVQRQVDPSPAPATPVRRATAVGPTLVTQRGTTSLPPGQLWAQLWARPPAPQAPSGGPAVAVQRLEDVGLEASAPDPLSPSSKSATAATRATQRPGLTAGTPVTHGLRLGAATASGRGVSGRASVPAPSVTTSWTAPPGVAGHAGSTEVVLPPATGPAVQRAEDAAATADPDTAAPDLPPAPETSTGEAPAVAGGSGEDSAPLAAGPPSGGPAHPGAGGPPSAGAAASQLDELARRLYEPITARLRAELWLDRERTGRSLTR